MSQIRYSESTLYPTQTRFYSQLKLLSRHANNLTVYFPDRVLYARKAGDDIAGSSVDAGEKITLESASVRNKQTMTIPKQFLLTFFMLGFERTGLGISQHAPQSRVVESWYESPPSGRVVCLWNQDT